MCLQINFADFDEKQSNKHEFNIKRAVQIATRTRYWLGSKTLYCTSLSHFPANWLNRCFPATSFRGDRSFNKINMSDKCIQARKVNSVRQSRKLKAVTSIFFSWCNTFFRWHSMIEFLSRFVCGSLGMTLIIANIFVIRVKYLDFPTYE